MKLFSWNSKHNFFNQHIFRPSRTLTSNIIRWQQMFNDRYLSNFFVKQLGWFYLSPQIMKMANANPLKLPTLGKILPKCIVMRINFFKSSLAFFVCLEIMVTDEWPLTKLFYFSFVEWNHNGTKVIDNFVTH